MLPLLLLAVLPPVGALELRHVQAIWRHGDRAPKRLPYPLDEHSEAAWPNGWAQLTGLGVQQMEELGAFFRSEYAGSFVDARFDRREVFVRSSDSERAIVSASAFLDGLFPPADRRHAPPVHGSPPTRRDPLLKPSDFDCPQYEEEARRLNAPLDAALQWKYRELLAFLGVHTGYGPNISLKEASGLNDLNRELAHQLPQPPWVHRRWPQFGGNTTLELVTEMKRARRVADFDKPALFRLRGGFLLADWLRRASGAARKRAEKMVLYSSHDGTLQALLHALGVADGQQIPYAACVILELHRDEAGSYFVRENSNPQFEATMSVPTPVNMNPPPEEYILDSRIHVSYYTYACLIVSCIVGLLSPVFIPGYFMAIGIIFPPLFHGILIAGVMKRWLLVLQVGLVLMIIMWFTGLLSIVAALSLELGQPHRGSWKLYILHTAALSGLETNVLLLAGYGLYRMIKLIKNDYSQFSNDYS
ncbi:hypothetical protein M3Y99_00679000 [Aphelenchoides fujianensis]|nr:hypothetical protein M3Y99_00679000 [Aphelenchoides fujianensis]